MTKSIITRQPENSSFLQPTKYILEFPDMPFLRYFCQSANLPDIATTAPPVPSPFATMYRHGDTLSYSELTVTAIIDEDIRIWEETYNWLVSLTKPEKFEQYIKYLNRNNKPYQDAILTIHNNSNIPNVRIKFFDCHPLSLSGINFDTRRNAGEDLVADIVFRYDIFNIERL